MKKLNNIIGLTLEGFQVFDKPTYIPLDRLTLLFGPNSAGKSAVQDAIELCEQLLGDESSAIYGHLYRQIKELTQRHWRRSGGNDDRCTRKMSIGVTYTTDAVLPDVIAGATDRKLLNKLSYTYPVQLESRWQFLHSDGIEDEDEGEGEGKGSWNWHFEFFIEGDLLVRYDNENSKLEVNLGHEVLRSIEKRVDFSKVAEANPKDVSFNDGYFTINQGVFGFNPAGGYASDRWLQYGQRGHAIMAFLSDNLGEQADQQLIETAVDELSLLVGTTLSISNNASSLGTYKVDASRNIPTRDELTFELVRGDNPNNWPLQDDPMYRSLPEGNPRYRKLARSLTSELRGSEDRAYADNVNRALSDHLFLEQGYRLDFDFRVLLSKANSAAAKEGAKLDPSEFGYLVELFLRDGQGRKHLFEDVGSGIGYVLPVLCAVLTSGGTCFIQQPELHLHPALQAAMGDVFIEASGAGSQVLVETHSEHLLLRILKRVRQTHLQTNIAPELKINADDVCVLYFDPSPDGTTTVKRLRITEDGEFMDRWPRGFFAERDQELLDE